MVNFILRLILVLSLTYSHSFAFAADEELSCKQVLSFDSDIFAKSAYDITASEAQDLEEAYTPSPWLSIPFTLESELSLNSRLSKVFDDLFPDGSIERNLKETISNVIVSFSAILYIAKNGYSGPLEGEFVVFLKELIRLNSLLDSNLESQTEGPWYNRSYSYLNHEERVKVLERVFLELGEIAQEFNQENKNPVASNRTKQTLLQLSEDIATQDFVKELRSLEKEFNSNGTPAVVNYSVTAIVAITGLFASMTFLYSIDFISWPWYLGLPTSMIGNIGSLAVSGAFGYKVINSIVSRFSPFNNRMDRIKEAIKTQPMISKPKESETRR